MHLIQIVICLIRGFIPLAVLFAYLCLGFDTVLGRILIMASSAILLHFSIDMILSVCLKKNPRTEPFPKTQTDAIKFTINAVIVVTGVLLGFIANQNEISCPENFIISIALVSYCLGILFGLINITLFTSGIESEYSYTTRARINQPAKTLQEVEMKTSIYYTVSIFLNLQFICLLVGIVATAFLHL